MRSDIHKLNLNNVYKLVIAKINAQLRCKYAVCGGIAASLYRDQFRITSDIDLMLSNDTPDNLVRIGKELLESFGYSVRVARKADLDGGPLFAIKRKNTPIQVIVGRFLDHEDAIGLDFLLPTMPWVEAACARAQSNMIDFGFGPVPTITVEDLIIAKLASSQRQAGRLKDLDDLESIFKAQDDLDIQYLCAQMRKLQYTLPPSLEKFAPQQVKWMSDTISKENKQKRK